MKILIAGGAGFVGTNLSRRCLDEGHEVTVLDTADRLKRFPHADATIVAGDVITVAPPGPWDCVVNLASPASVETSLEDPLRTLRVNIHGTDKMCQLAHSVGARFVFSSTSEIYGDPLVHPQSEDYFGNVNPTGVRSPYNEGKRAAEAVTAAWQRQHGLDAGIVRFFNGYGPGLDDGRVMSRFVRAALERRPLPIYGQGSNTRSFCYIDDLVDGAYRLMTRPGLLGPYNIGRPAEVTIAELASIVHAVVADTGIEYLPATVEDVHQRCPDISRAREDLGYEPKVRLEDGISRLAAWMADRAAA